MSAASWGERRRHGGATATRLGSVTGGWDVGGLVAINTGTVSNSYWDAQTSGRTTSAGGTGTNTVAMKQQNDLCWVGFHERVAYCGERDVPLVYHTAAEPAGADPAMPALACERIGFGFNITGTSGLVIVVEEPCTNLADPIWSPVGTNTLTSGLSYFSDPQWTN